MDLAVASAWFNQEPIYDAYTAAYLYDAQSSSFKDQQSTGSMFQKRSLELLPGQTLPTRRGVLYAGQPWIVGEGVTDSFQGSLVRTNHVMMSANFSMTPRTPAQAAKNAGGTLCFAHRFYLRSGSDGMTSAEFDPYYEIYTAPSEVVTTGYFLFGATGEKYLVRSRHVQLDGFVVLESDELDDPSFVSVVLGAPTYDPISDTYSGSTLATSAMFFEAFKAYSYLSPASPKHASGDKILVVDPADGSLTVSQVITVSAVDYRVLSKTSLSGGDFYLVRRA